MSNEDDIEYNPDIHLKAQNILSKRDYINECLEADICPKCSAKLSSKTDDHGFTHYRCTLCFEEYFRTV